MRLFCFKQIPGTIIIVVIYRNNITDYVLWRSNRFYAKCLPVQRRTFEEKEKIQGDSRGIPKKGHSTEFRIHHNDPIEVSRFRKRLASDKKNERIRFVLIVGMTLIIIMILFYWIINADYSSIVDVIS